MIEERLIANDWLAVQYPPSRATSAKEMTPGSYNPQVEAISPTPPSDEVRDGIKQSKDELLTNINKIDREILRVEQNIQKLETKQVQISSIVSTSSSISLKDHA